MAKNEKVTNVAVKDNVPAPVEETKKPKKAKVPVVDTLEEIKKHPLPDVRDKKGKVANRYMKVTVLPRKEAKTIYTIARTSGGAISQAAKELGIICKVAKVVSMDEVAALLNSLTAEQRAALLNGAAKVS